MISARATARFRGVVLGHYSQHGRDLPWRRTHDPYKILVSEVMLQQTQVARVLPKYGLFLSLFPRLGELAAAPLSAVLATWQGLGYNRRALALHRTAQIVVSEHEERLPRSASALQRLPGIGPATAAAVCVFAYNDPLVFIETNIRSAFLDHFFAERSTVSDAEILPLIAATLDRDDPRNWYYALMDYGAWLKRTQRNPSRRSKHHTAQTRFHGSRRQLRAQILGLLLRPTATHGGTPEEATDTARTLGLAEIVHLLPNRDPLEIQAVMTELLDEGFVSKRDDRYCIA